MRTLLLCVAVLVACSSKQAAPDDHAKVDTAKREAEKYAYEGFPRWAAAHAEKACPAGLDELNQYVGRKDTNDPWGHPYKLLCGPTLPPGAPGFAVVSSGPDGKDGTTDDVKSWEK